MAESLKKGSDGLNTLKSSGWRPVKPKGEAKPRRKLGGVERRLLVFLVLVAAIFAYLNWKAGEFNREAQVRRPGDRGDAVLVTAPDVGGEVAEQPRDFFAATRLERERARSERLELLKDVIRDEKTTAQARAGAQQELLSLNARSGKEAEVESLLRAKGFPRAVVLLSERGANVIVQARRLDSKDVARIADITAAVAGVPFEAVRIIPYER